VVDNDILCNIFEEDPFLSTSGIAEKLNAAQQIFNKSFKKLFSSFIRKTDETFRQT